MSNIPQGCKPFNLQEALAGKPVVTRDGRAVKIAGYNPEADEDFKIIGWISGIPQCWSENGTYFDSCVNSNYELFMAPETKDVWVGLYSTKECDYFSSIAFKDEDSAKKMVANCKVEGSIFHGIHKITITL